MAPSRAAVRALMARTYRVKLGSLGQLHGIESVGYMKMRRNRNMKATNNQSSLCKSISSNHSAVNLKHRHRRRSGPADYASLSIGHTRFSKTSTENPMLHPPFWRLLHSLSFGHACRGHGSAGSGCNSKAARV